MKQLELPFTKRGRRDFRRLRGVNRRAFKCWHNIYPSKKVLIFACDNADARRQFLEQLREALPKVKFTDLRARRAPEYDGRENQSNESRKASKRKR